VSTIAAQTSSDGGTSDGRGARVLLLGKEAASLGPRLALSGYQPLDAESRETAEDGGAAGPAAVVLAPGGEGSLPGLRQRWGAVPILLGLRADSIDERE
jgi:hypothetical protein